MLAPFVDPTPPSQSDIRTALDRICANPPLAQAPMLTRFLRFVVEVTLSGQGSRLKGYTIGVGALGRREDFNPQIDPIVRVEAIRLRAALARYYSAAGASDAVVIDIPRGGYVPRFRWSGRRRRTGWDFLAAVRKLRRVLGIRVVLHMPPPR
jgi:hypothetical protein